MPVPDVAIVSPYPAPGPHEGRSGVATYTRNLARSLAGAGAAVAVVAQEEPGQPASSEDAGVRIERRFRPGTSAWAAAAGAALATGAPLVHVQHEMFLLGGPAQAPTVVAALAALRLAGRGPVVTMHQVVDPATVDGGFTLLHRVGVPPRAARAAIAGLQGAVSGLARATIVHERSFAALVHRARPVPHGIQPTPATAPEAATEARPSLTVVCFGFIAPYKGLEVALGAAELAGPEVRMVVAGAEHPRMEGSGYAEGLRRRWGHVAEFTGYVPAGEVGALMGRAGVVLLPYPRPFASSGAMATALGHAAPVLASPALAASAGLPAGLVAPDDPASLARRLRALARDPAARRELSALSQEVARGRTWPEVAATHLAIYEEVSRAKRRAGRAIRPLRAR